MTKRLEVVKVIREVRAWDLGADDWAGAKNERARVKGGRSLYETVWSCADRNARKAWSAGGVLKDVRLGRVEARVEGPYPVARWVDGDTMLEVVEVREGTP